MNKYSSMEARIASICTMNDARCVGNGAHRRKLVRDKTEGIWKPMLSCVRFSCSDYIPNRKQLEERSGISFLSFLFGL